MSNLRYLVSLKYNQFLEKYFNLISFSKINSCWQSCLGKYVMLSRANGFPMNNQNVKSNSHMNAIITPRNKNIDFYNNHNYIKTTFDNSDHH